MKVIKHNKTDIDLIVYGGTLKGCDAALKAAGKGLRVVLAEARTFLGTDIIASHSFRVSSESLTGYTPELVSCLKDGFAYEEEGFGLMHPGLLKRNLLELLRENGIEVLFMFQAAGVLKAGNRVCGGIFATKGGLVGIRSGSVLDATLFLDLAQSSGADVRLENKTVSARRTVQFVETEGEMPAVLKAASLEFTCYRGYRDEKHIICEYAYSETLNTPSWIDRMDILRKAVRTNPEVCEGLRKSAPVLAQGKLFAVSPEIAYTDVSVTADNLPQGLMTEAADEAEITDVPEPESAVFTDTECSLKDCASDICSDRRFSISYMKLDPPQEGIDALSSVDVLVAGGGTAGVPAAVSAGRHGCSVALIEYFAGLGGTTTLGGITGYYHGYREGYTSELDEKIRVMTEKVSRDPHHWLWNIEARMFTSFLEVEKEGGTVWYRGMTVSTLYDGNTVTGAVISFPGGLMKVSSKITIDATGDGDIAAGAGAEFTIGDGPNIQTCNMCREGIKESERLGVNVDLDVIDITRPFDLSRGIHSGYMHSGEEDTVSMLTVRESRHIIGDYIYSEEDVLLGRRFPDTVMISDTDFDTHGLQASEIARLGFMPYHKDEKHVRFPFRITLPKGLEGILVTGKAFSSTKDAGAFGRMEPDLQNLGYACGKAACMAIQGNCSLREIDISELTAHLLEIGNILSDDLGEHSDSGMKPGKAVTDLASGSEAALLPVLCLKRERVLSLLKDAYSESSGKGRKFCAMALAWFGCSDGEDELLAELDVQLERETPEEYIYDGRPNGGWVEKPSSYWQVNQLVYLLGKCNTPRSIQKLSSIAEKTGPGGQRRDQPRLHWKRVPLFNRILNLALALRESGSPEAGGALESILDKELISGYAEKEQLDGDMNYAGALLEIYLAEAAARCGSEKGIKILNDYTEDVRDVLSLYALKTLDELGAGVD